MMNKFVKLILIFGVIFGIFNTSVLYSYAIDEVEEYTFYTVNPMYSEIVDFDYTPRKFTLRNTSENFMDGKNAGEYVREKLVNRESSITFTLVSDNDDPGAVYYNEIEPYIFLHTGNPKEGDYLYYNYGGSQIRCRTLISDRYYHEFTINSVFYSTSEEEVMVDQKVNELMNSLKLEDESLYNKIATIYNYITEHVVYDFENLEDESYTKKYSAYAALINGTSVCQGYASLLYRLALEAGVDCRVITGVSFGDNHAWNIVGYEGRYYLMDSTWDAGYEPNYSYFMKSIYEFDEHGFHEQFLSEDFMNQYPYATQSLVYERPILHDQEFNYYIENDNSYITEYIGNDENVVIPSMIGGCPTVSIGSYAFNNNESINTLTINNGIKYLDDNIINNCDYLNQIIFKGDMPNFSNQTFEGNVLDIYHPCDWASNSLSDYGGSINWVKKHNYSIEIIEPTCTQQGYTKYTCTCQDTYQDHYVAAKGHLFNNYINNNDGTQTSKCAYCDKTDTVIHEFIIGDVNGDSIVSPTDCTFLARYLAEWTDYPASSIDMTASDTNCDGEVTPSDITILVRHLAEWTGYETLPYKN